MYLYMNWPGPDFWNKSSAKTWINIHNFIDLPRVSFILPMVIKSSSCMVGSWVVMLKKVPEFTFRHANTESKVRVILRN